MLKLWLAPHGLHIEPALAADAETVARLHAQGFYRGWPREEFAAYIAGPDTPSTSPATSAAASPASPCCGSLPTRPS